MPGIRVDTEWLTRYAEDVRAAGEEVVAAQQDLDTHALRASVLGELGQRTGAIDAYARVAALLADQTRRAGEVLVNAGNELRQVVDFHSAGDDDSAHGLARKQEQ